VDSGQLAQTWLGIASDQLNGIANNDGKLPTEVVAERVSQLYGLLYDGWDFLNGVNTPKEDR
jgi:hypothetical protein